MDPWDTAKALAAELGISFLDVMPMWSLDTLFSDERANFYIWPAGGQRTAIKAWLTEHGCAWQGHPGDPRVIVACGSQVAHALQTNHHTEDAHV